MVERVEENLLGHEVDVGERLGRTAVDLVLVRVVDLLADVGHFPVKLERDDADLKGRKRHGVEKLAWIDPVAHGEDDSTKRVASGASRW